MTEDQVRAGAARAERARTQSAFWFTLYSLAFAALGVFIMVHDGTEEARTGGWVLIVLFAPGALLGALSVVRSFRRPRWKGRRLEARRLVLDSAAGILFLAAYSGLLLWMTWMAWGAHQFAWAAYAFMSSCAWVGLLFLSASQLFDARPVIIVDEAGYFDRRLTLRPISWERVERLARGRLFASDQERNCRLGPRINAFLGNRSFEISAGALDCTKSDLFLAIHHYAPRLFGPGKAGASENAAQVASHRFRTAKLGKPPAIPGISVADISISKITLGVTGANRNALLRLLKWLPYGYGLHFFDQTRNNDPGQEEDPGMYVTIMRSKSNFAWKGGNHGWSTKWTRETRKFLAEWLERNLKPAGARPRPLTQIQITKEPWQPFDRW